MNTAAVVLAPVLIVDQKPHAHSIGTDARKNIALQVLAGGKPTHIAKENNVSRKFIYSQVNVAKDAVDNAFAASAAENEKVLFTISVTKSFLRRMIISLLLRCHSPYRGVIAFLAEVFDHSVSIGTIHNIVQDAVTNARSINETICLDGIKNALHDEIYQNGLPVLVGVDAYSSFCYLLAAEDSCDGTTWGCHLLDLKEKGFTPQCIVADQGKGLRAGLNEVYPNVPCFADIFHVLKDFGDVLRFYENRLVSATEELEKVESKMKKLQRKREKQSKFSRALGDARKKQNQLSDLVFVLCTLQDWLRHDILAIAGPTFPIRTDLLNFVIEELRAKEGGNGKVASLRQKLENVKDDVLGFVRAIDDKLSFAAVQNNLPLEFLEKIAIMLSRSHSDLHRYEIETELRAALRNRYHLAVSIVADCLASTPRASSLVESVNSRLRSNFFLRRTIGHGYLDLMQYFLNHRVLERSDRAHRIGKTPREILTGEAHQNWLDILGFPKVKQAS